MTIKEKNIEMVSVCVQKISIMPIQVNFCVLSMIHTADPNYNNFLCIFGTYRFNCKPSKNSAGEELVFVALT